MIRLLAMILLWIVLLSLHQFPGCVYSLEKVHSQTHTVSDVHSKPSRVIQLTSRNFGQVFWSRKVWLIEFYSPKCIHCTEFAESYEDIARQVYSDNIHVAKINGETERALIQRFGIKAYPSFFIVDGFSVYQFMQHRTKQTLLDFCHNYKTDSVPLAILTSPMGPLGLLQGFLVSSGLFLSDVFDYGQERGLSPVVVGAALFGTFFLLLFLLIVCLALSIPARPKQD